MEAASLVALAAACAPQVATTTAQALVAVESGRNPHAIGVVGGTLDRQPRSLPEALATARALRADGWNFSLGLGQINVSNFARLGLTLESAFDPCSNLAAMQAVLGECYKRAGHRNPAPQRALQQAVSCYYSGNFRTGFEHGYVRRVLDAAARLRAASTPLSLPAARPVFTPSTTTSEST